MRKLILKMSMSLDGFVGGPNGEMDWMFGHISEEGIKWTVDHIRQAGVHIMGSRTFYDMAAYWPYSTEPFAPPMNEIPKIVFSKKGLLPLNKWQTTAAFKDATDQQNKTGLKQSSPSFLDSWIHAKVVTGDLKEEIMKLKQQGGKDIIAHGGASFARSLISTGLIDEYQLLIYPVALGKGLPIFNDLSKPLNLQLANMVSFLSGVVAHVYLKH